MKRQKLQIGRPLQVEVTWYDNCLEPPAERKYAGEVIGWRKASVTVRVKDYAVLRFWQRTGLEVGNRDYDRRGFRVDMALIIESIKPASGVVVTFEDQDEVPILPPGNPGQVDSEKRG